MYMLYMYINEYCRRACAVRVLATFRERPARPCVVKMYLTEHSRNCWRNSPALLSPHYLHHYSLHQCHILTMPKCFIFLFI